MQLAGRRAGDRPLVLSGAHNAIVPRVMELLRKKDMNDVLVIVGDRFRPGRRSAQGPGRGGGVQPGASLDKIVDSSGRAWRNKV